MARGIRGTIHCSLTGGPLDGMHYGDLPDPGPTVKTARLSIPLAQPAENSPRALYACSRPSTPDEVWAFEYIGTKLPDLPVGSKASFR